MPGVTISLADSDERTSLESSNIAHDQGDDTACDNYLDEPQGDIQCSCFVYEMSEDDHLAYGDYSYHTAGRPAERGFLDNAVHELQNGGVSTLLDRLSGAVKDIRGRLSDLKVGALSATDKENRFGSFAQPRRGNEVKWYVDGCGYFWAVSEALEQARETIWILDWWLSPELYLRRPPTLNEEYRLDRLLKAAAERGVKVNVLIYKEVPQALTLSSEYTKKTLEALHPNIAVFRHPDHVPDVKTLESKFASAFESFSPSAASIARLPGDAIKAIYGTDEDVILYWAHHEKLCLIDGEMAFMGGLDLCYGRWDLNQHPIADVHPTDPSLTVFPGADYNDARILDFQDVAQPEKNELDKTKSPRMGWSDISIALRGPGLADLENHFMQRWNFIYSLKYDLRKDDRYAPLSLTRGSGGRQTEEDNAITGPASRSELPVNPRALDASQNLRLGSPGQSDLTEPTTLSTSENQGHVPPAVPHFPSPPTDSNTRSTNVASVGPNHAQSISTGSGDEGSRAGRLENRNTAAVEGGRDDLTHTFYKHEQVATESRKPTQGSATIQLVRSCAKWSNGTHLEQSIQSAYISTIRNARHFLYIENQFFITATSSGQKPVMNRIGEALVDRILRAARSGEKFKVTVVIPAVPGFPGDLRDESSLGTRAIMEFQYNSINRGGKSIMEEINAAGFNPMDYIRFYNLRNYDRINYSPKLQQFERDHDLMYEDARRKAEDTLDHAGQRARNGSAPASNADYSKFQEAANATFVASENLDSVSHSYMLGGPDIRTIPWEGDAESEINAFVSEELYIHTKLLIADDRVVICGSANLNDRSQVGDHDSEIAMVIEDEDLLDSYMDGRPWKANTFAATLRRQLYRKHLGIIPPQDMMKPDANFRPVGVPNDYDFGSPEDHLVQDPLADTFLNFWNSRARRNTEAFRRLFRAVPDDTVRTWNDYGEFYEKYFHDADEEAGGKTVRQPAKYLWGHVVREDFAPGQEGVDDIKNTLSSIKGTLVEMPLMFLIEEDIAKQGLSLNAITEPIYT